MYTKLFLGLLLCFLFSGCVHLNHIKPKPQVAPLAISRENDSKENEEKIWVDAKTNKIWVNQHVDESGDLIDGHYKHVVITPGHWAVKEIGKQ